MEHLLVYWCYIKSAETLIISDAYTILWTNLVDVRYVDRFRSSLMTSKQYTVLQKYSYRYQIKLCYAPLFHIQTVLAYVNMPKMPLKCLKIWENSRKSSKIAKKTRFYPKFVLQYFSNHCRYGSNIFVGSKHNLWVVFEPIMGCLTHPPVTPPSHLVNCCLFRRFLVHFGLSRGLGQQKVNTCWPKFWNMLTNP